MKPQNSIRLIWVFVMLSMIITACTMPKRKSPDATLVPVTAVPAPTEPQPTPVPPGFSPADLPSKQLDQADDANSSSLAAAKNISAGDSFVQGLYERPINADTMDKYFPYMDIVHIKGYTDDTWGYLEISLADTNKTGKLPAQYAAELDLDKDGHGDWLIRASSPASTSWTTQGVQAWQDADRDVGGIVSMAADSNQSNGNGYETLVFNQGKGHIPNGAWVRISPDDPKSVQIAIKLSMIGSPSSFAMGAWAGDKIDPSKFDYNDHLTHVQAGDPNQGYPQVYPVKALAQIDNTCRLAMGFVPTSVVPGLCEVPQIQHPGAAPTSPIIYHVPG